MGGVREIREADPWARSLTLHMLPYGSSRSSVSSVVCGCIKKGIQHKNKKRVRSLCQPEPSVGALCGSELGNITFVMWVGWWITSSKQKRIQFKWFGHLVRIPPWCLHMEVFWICPGMSTQGRPKTRSLGWRENILETSQKSLLWKDIPALVTQLQNNW